MNINIRTIPHSEQRYPTTGDFEVITDEPGLFMNVRVSKMGNWKFEFLVGIHELIEAALCHDAGIKDEDITAFDKAYEEAREAGVPAPCGCPVTSVSEPGDDRHAPYFDQHQAATQHEIRLAEELNVDWDVYELANLALYEKAGGDATAP